MGSCFTRCSVPAPLTHPYRVRPPLSAAVVRLPFPDVEAISCFVEEQLGLGGSSSGDEGEGEGGASGPRLSAEERSRDAFHPALLMLSAESHPLGLRLLVGGNGSSEGGPADGAAAAAAVEEEAAEGDEAASVLSLLLPQPPGSSIEHVSAQGVLILPLDLAGQDTPPFSAGLLPGATS